jgi:hypothetical protein
LRTSFGKTSITLQVWVIFTALFTIIAPKPLCAEPVAVKYTEGLVHGFLVLRTLEGTPIADGDLTQVAHGGRITSHLVFHFRDGSIDDETAVFTQRGHFQLVSHHLVQKGPSFKRAIETTLNTSKSQLTVRYTDDDGKEKVLDPEVKVPDDLANGLVFTLLKNLDLNATRSYTVSYMVATPKPRFVKFVITPQGEDPFSIGASARKANHFAIKVDIGGAAGLVAPILGKQPPDIHVWVSQGEAPTFVKSEQPLYEGGPVWRIELATPNRQ